MPKPKKEMTVKEAKALFARQAEQLVAASTGADVTGAINIEVYHGSGNNPYMQGVDYDVTVWLGRERYGFMLSSGSDKTLEGAWLRAAKGLKRRR